MGSNFIKWENTIFSVHIGVCKAILYCQVVLCSAVGDALKVDNDKRNVVIFFYC